MGGEKVWTNGERVLSCMVEQCPATPVTLNVCKVGRSRFRRRARDGLRLATVVEPAVVVGLRIPSYLVH